LILLRDPQTGQCGGEYDKRANSDQDPCAIGHDCHLPWAFSSHSSATGQDLNVRTSWAGGAWSQVLVRRILGMKSTSRWVDGRPGSCEPDHLTGFLQTPGQRRRGRLAEGDVAE